MRHQRSINEGWIFRTAKRLKKAGIPFLKFEFSDREDGVYGYFTADSWAVKKAMHPFEGCNPSFTLWDSKVRGKAVIAFKVF